MTVWPGRLASADACSRRSCCSRCCSAVASIPAAVADAAGPSLVAAYAFDEGAGATVSDASGNNNTGSIVTATWTNAGRFGNALTFNGTDSLVQDRRHPSATADERANARGLDQPDEVSSDAADVIYKGNDNYYLSGTSSISRRPAEEGSSAAPMPRRTGRGGRRPTAGRTSR